MSQSRDLVRAILLQMYPGDGIVPPANEVEKFDACVEDIVTSPRIDNSYLRAFDDCADINDFLKAYKRIDSQGANELINISIRFYFSDPEVISLLTGSPLPLYPNERSLPDIEVELLEPVYLRMMD